VIRPLRWDWGHTQDCWPNGYCIYFDQQYHGQIVYRVPTESATADLPAVANVLDKRGEEEWPQDVKQGFLAWKHIAPPDNDVPHLLAEMRNVRLERLYREDRSRYEWYLDDEAKFEQRWERSQRFWLTVLFEFAWITGVIIFTAYPWLKRLGRLAWSVHLGLLPVLLMLPYYLGYAPFALKYIFPNGGVLYPDFIMWANGLPWTQRDTTLMTYVPSIFEPLCQPIGPLTGCGGSGGGPIAVAIVSLVIGSSVFAIASLFQWLRPCRKE
jgi:hypothetical protein